MGPNSIKSILYYKQFIYNIWTRHTCIASPFSCRLNSFYMGPNSIKVFCVLHNYICFVSDIICPDACVWQVLLTVVAICIYLDSECACDYN